MAKKSRRAVPGAAATATHQESGTAPQSQPDAAGVLSRREMLRRRKAARQRRQALIYSSIVLAAVVVIGGLWWYSVRDVANCANLQDPIKQLYTTLPPSVPFPQVGVKLVASPYSKGLPEAGEERTVPSEGQQHVSILDIPYQNRPPTSGPHFDITAPYRFSDREVPEGNFVHSLEHGAIVLLYDCASGRTAALAWTHILPMQGIDVAKVTEFYNKYVDKGPEAVP